MSANLTAAQLVKDLAARTGLTGPQVKSVLESLAAVAGENLKDGNTVTVPGVARIVLKSRPERQVRNPATGETMTKPADKTLRITAVKALKDVVQE